MVICITCGLCSLDSPAPLWAEQYCRLYEHAGNQGFPNSCVKTGPRLWWVSGTWAPAHHGDAQPEGVQELWSSWGMSQVGCKGLLLWPIHRNSHLVTFWRAVGLAVNIPSGSVKASQKQGALGQQVYVNQSLTPRGKEGAFYSVDIAPWKGLVLPPV